MSLMLALKAFMKAWKDPRKAADFCNDHVKENDHQDFSHLRLLSILQSSGRIIDFLKEDIAQFSDAQVGAAVRKIHQECSKTLEDMVTIRPLMEEKEGASVTVPDGYDPKNIKVVGKVKGQPPYKGILIHKGWKAHKRSLPKQITESNSQIISPAEIEVR